MRAVIVDPEGPRWIRMLAPVAASLIVALGIALRAPWDERLLLAGAALLALAPLVAGRRRPREVRLELGAGFIDVVDADPGLLTQRIRGRHLRGASTSQLDRGVGLLLQARDRPIALELDEQADAAAVLAALGVGHGGFGWIDLDAEPDRAAGVARALRRLAIAPLVGGIVAALVHYREPLTPMLAIGFWGMVSALIAGTGMAIRAGLSPRSRLRLEPGGISVEDRGVGPLVVTYDSIAHVAATPDRLLLRLRSGQDVAIRLLSSAWALFGGLTHAQRAHAVAQIHTASLRARGLGSLPEPVAEAVTALGRGPEPAGAWLRRLDVTASSMRGEGAYRAGPLTREDLWKALESPDAVPGERAAAARILIGLEGSAARERILRIASAAREGGTEERIRIVLETDADAAARKLDAIEAAEAEAAERGRVARAPAA